MTRLLSLTIVLVGSLAAASDTWPGFRGAGDSSTAALRLPVQWSEAENIAWKATLPGYGQSNPVVWKDTVFVTAVTGDEREKGFIVAFDLATGKERWRHAFAPTQKAKWSNYISKAAPTPVVDEHGIYAFFEGGDVIALSHDGKQRWTRSLVKDYGEFQNNHGLAASPVVTGEAVAILVDDRGPSYLVALDKATGKNLWKVDRPQKGSWTSPVVSTARNEIVISSNGSVSGHDLKTGAKRWELDDFSGNTIPSAAVVGDRVIVGAGAGKGLLQQDRRDNRDQSRSGVRDRCDESSLADRTGRGVDSLRRRRSRWRPARTVGKYPLSHRKIALVSRSAEIVVA